MSTRNLYQRPRNGGSTARAPPPWPAKRARNHRVRNKFDDISHPAVIIMTVRRVGSAGPLMQARSPPNLMGPYPPKHQLADFAAIAVRSRRRERRADVGRATPSALVNGSCISEPAREPNTEKRDFCPATMTSDRRSFCYRQPDLYCTMIDRSARERIG